MTDNLINGADIEWDAISGRTPDSVRPLPRPIVFRPNNEES